MKLWRVGDPVTIRGKVWRIVAKIDPPARYNTGAAWFDVMNFAGQRQRWCPWPEGAE